MPFNFFFSVIKSHVFHLKQVILILITFPKNWRLVIHGTYFLGFNHLEFIHHIVNNIVIFLFLMKPFPRYGIAPTVLSSLGCSVLSFKFAQDLIFIRIMPSAMDHTFFYAIFEKSKIIYVTCQRSHPSQGECLTRWILISYYYLVQ